MDISEDELDRLADRITERVILRINEQYELDLVWAHNQRLKDVAHLNSRRRVLETITGTAGAVGFLALMGWLGHVIIQTVADLMRGAL